VQQYLTIWDVVLSPIYLIILNFLATRYRDRKYPKRHPLRKYYLPGLYLKFGGVIFIALLYQYYYNGGDTYNFFTHAQTINSSLDDSFITWIKLLFRVPVESDPKLYNYVANLYWYNDTSSYTVSRIAAVLGLLNGTSYIPIALLFAFISYSGIWAMYETFYKLYPKLHRELAIAFLFIPSTFVWGSAVFKDTICMFGLGWLTTCTFRVFVGKDLSIRNLFLLALSFYLIALIKLYILLAFIPALSLWLFLTYSHKIRSGALRFLVALSFIGIIGGALFVFSAKFAQEMNQYSLDKLAKTAATTQGWIAYVSQNEEGSGYDIGQFDPTVGGMLSKFPQGVVVTLFRPFLWEVKKPIMALSALEALAFLYFTLRLIFKNGSKFITWTVRDPNLLFFLVFSLIFAFAVGVSTGNFGSLSRYKIPCMPFYAAFLMILLHKQKLSTPTKKQPNARKPVHHLT
jgi:hypothetical protein